MKKLSLFLFIFVFISKIFSFTSNDIRYLTFENGLKMFLIEDTSSAIVRMEIRVNAGYSKQDEKTSGYFPLYSRLKDAVIDSESVSKELTCAPSDAEKTMQLLSELLEPLKINDKTLRNEINLERLGLNEFYDEAGFINSAIESKLFPTNPWKRESSANPNVFTQNSLSESRSILNRIARDFYTPDNTVLYINGNITANAAETFANRYFSKFTNKKNYTKESELETKIKKEIANKKTEKRFVLTDETFSNEMTQIVVQYKTLGQFECDIAATTMNEDFSELKEKLTKETSLGIRGAEYINVSSSQKSDSSRLIVQSLLEKTKTPPTEQIKTFLGNLSGELFSSNALQYEIRQYTRRFIQKCDSSTDLMKILADWYSIRNDDNPEKTLFERINTLEKINAKTLSDKITSEEPFVFVLMNTKIYEKYAKSFKNLGFIQITKKNGAYYNQSFYKNLLKTKNSKANEIRTEKDIEQSDEETFESAKRFVERNTNDFRLFKLSNSIPVVMKKTETNTAHIAITIQGGDLLFADTPGLTSVLVDSIAVNIRSQLDLMHYNGYTRGIYDVNAKTNTTSSVINVSFTCDEYIQIINAITGALIYGDITPALADGVSYDERTQWKLKTGTNEFQQLCYAIKKLYPNEKISLLYDESTDKPKKLDYTQIMIAYPKILDSSRYSLVITGNFKADEYFTSVLDSTFGTLGTNNETKAENVSIQKPKFDSLEKRIQLKHLFLTDVSADKAGPKPAILIPTTKFLDPILYIMDCPELLSKDNALFNAILLELGRRIEQKAQRTENTTKTKIYAAEKDLPFARIIVSNVERTSYIDKYFKEAIEELKSDLEKIVNEETEITKVLDTELEEIVVEETDENGNISQTTKTVEKQVEKTTVKLIDLEKNELISRIENKWIMENLFESGTAEGTASLIQKSSLLGKPNLYLEHYSIIDNATAADYYLILSKYFKDIPPIRIYSVDSKK